MVNGSGKSFLLQLHRSGKKRSRPATKSLAQRSPTLPEYEKQHETVQFYESLNPLT